MRFGDPWQDLRRRWMLMGGKRSYTALRGRAIRDVFSMLQWACDFSHGFGERALPLPWAVITSAV